VKLKCLQELYYYIRIIDDQPVVETNDSGRDTEAELMRVRAEWKLYLSSEDR
jgi:hypothetical protein